MSEKTDVYQELLEVQNKLNALQDRTNDLLEKYENGELDLDTFYKKITQAEKENNELLEELNKLGPVIKKLGEEE